MKKLFEPIAYCAGCIAWATIAGFFAMFEFWDSVRPKEQIQYSISGFVKNYNVRVLLSSIVFFLFCIVFCVVALPFMIPIGLYRMLHSGLYDMSQKKKCNA